MLNAKNLAILAAVTALAALSAIWINRQPSAPPEPTGAALFPELLDQINEVRAITVTTSEGNFTIERGETAWTVTEKSYPAAAEQIQRVLVGVAQLRKIEPKTSNPELHPKLQLEDVTEPEAKSVLLQLRGADQQTLVSLIVGKQRFSRGDPGAGELYVRKSEEPQAWLVAGNLRVEQKPEDWLDKTLLDIDDKRIREVSLAHKDGEQLVIVRDNQEQTDYAIRDLPEDAKVDSAFSVNNIARTLATMKFEDVSPDSEVSSVFAEGASLTTSMDTFDGLRVQMETVEEGEKIYARLSAEVTEAVTQPTAEAEEKKEADAKEGETAKETVEEPTPEQSIEELVAELNARFEGRAFVIPQWVMNSVAKKREDLIKAEDEAEATPEEATAEDEAPEQEQPEPESSADTS